jgi:hypothetical protein
MDKKKMEEMKKFMQKAEGKIEEMEVTYKWEKSESCCGKMQDCNSHNKKAMSYKE